MRSESSPGLQDQIPLRFSYVGAEGHLKDVVLERWRERGLYLQGFAQDGRWKTYRIDRVQQYLDGVDRLLAEPFQTAPEYPSKRDTSFADWQPQMLFTGFKKEASVPGGLSERAMLKALAGRAGFKVVVSVTKNLRYLVCGATAGPSKIEKARAANVFLLRKIDFEKLIETGELPDSECQRLGDHGRPELERLRTLVKSWMYAIEPHHLDALHAFDFRDGDIFYGRGDPNSFLQVACCHDDVLIEVHTGQVGADGSRRGYLLDAEQLVYWLQTGRVPIDVQPVYRGTSTAGLLGWQLQDA